MRSMAGLLSLVVGVCSVGAGGERQEPSEWVVDLQAPLVKVYEEVNERGQVIRLGEREISFRLTRPADSVVVEVLFSTYVGSSGSPTYLRYAMTEEYPYPADWNEVRCSESIGIPVWRKRFQNVPAEGMVVAAWDYLWDEELTRGYEVASWGGEAYGGGLTKADPWKFVIVETAVPHRGRGLSCREWLPDPYHPEEIWGTWRHDERGRVVQGGYVIRTIAYAGGEKESRVHMQPSLAALATENGVDEDEVVRRVLLEGQEEFWGWYSIPGPGSGTLLSEMRWQLEQVGVDSLKRAHPWLDRTWDWRKGP